MKAKIKAYLNHYLEDHRQELYPSGGLPRQEWIYDAMAEFVEVTATGKQQKNP